MLGGGEANLNLKKAGMFPLVHGVRSMALAMGCLALCVLTTARAGLLGMILGLILVAIFTRKLKLLFNS